MQILLTEEEYKELKERIPKEKYLKTLKDLQKVCTLAANYTPIYRTWDINDRTPWGCIIEKNNYYCDECAVKCECPYKNKQWSK